MSASPAPRISAVPGHDYLTFSGRRLHVVLVGRDRVIYYDHDAPSIDLESPRSIFDTCIESVLK